MSVGGVEMCINGDGVAQELKSNKSNKKASLGAYYPLFYSLYQPNTSQ